MNTLQIIGAIGSCVCLFGGLVIGRTLNSDPIVAFGIIGALLFVLVFAVGRMTAGEK